MDGQQGVLMDAIFEILSEKIDPALLKKAYTKEMKKKLVRRLTDEFFYKLFKEGKLTLCPGFGSIFLKNIREKDKKVFDKKTGTMVFKKIKGRKIVYKPGDVIREFL